MVDPVLCHTPHFGGLGPGKVRPPGKCSDDHHGPLAEQATRKEPQMGPAGIRDCDVPILKCTNWGLYVLKLTNIYAATFSSAAGTLASWAGFIGFLVSFTLHSSIAVRVVIINQFKKRDM